MKAKLTSAKTARDPDSKKINKSLRAGTVDKICLIMYTLAILI